MMREGQAIAIHRADYAAPAYWIDTVDLTFDLDPAKTRVLSRLRVRRIPVLRTFGVEQRSHLGVPARDAETGLRFGHGDLR